MQMQQGLPIEERREEREELLNWFTEIQIQRGEEWSREEREELLDWFCKMQIQQGEEMSREKREKLLNLYFCNREIYNDKIYITAAFRSHVKNEIYLFMGNEYVLLHYVPGTHDDKVLNGPNLIRKGFRALADTDFGEYGIYCAFRSHQENEAFIFCGNECARIEYAPGTTAVKFLEGPTSIDSIFPFLEGTVFEDGVDAAFESSTTDEAYLFDKDKYARINYRDGGRLISSNLTFSCLEGTIFQSQIDAALASDRPNVAYLFKEDSYTLINYAQDYMIGGVQKILPDKWPSLNGILPRKNYTISDDVYYYDNNDDDVDDVYSDEVGSLDWWYDADNDEVVSSKVVDAPAVRCLPS